MEIAQDEVTSLGNFVYNLKLSYKSTKLLLIFPLNGKKKRQLNFSNRKKEHHTQTYPKLSYWELHFSRSPTWRLPQLRLVIFHHVAIANRTIRPPVDWNGQLPHHFPGSWKLKREYNVRNSLHGKFGAILKLWRWNNLYLHITEGNRFNVRNWAVFFKSSSVIQDGTMWYFGYVADTLNNMKYYN